MPACIPTEAERQPPDAPRPGGFFLPDHEAYDSAPQAIRTYFEENENVSFWFDNDFKLLRIAHSEEENRRSKYSMLLWDELYRAFVEGN